MFVTLIIVALLPHIVIAIRDLSRGNPVPVNVVIKPPLLPPVDEDNDVHVIGILIGLTPIAKSAIPLSVIETRGVISPT